MCIYKTAMSAAMMSVLAFSICGCIEKSNAEKSLAVAKKSVPLKVSEENASQTDLVITAANSFLESLTADQKSKVLFGFVANQTATAAEFLGGGMGNQKFIGEKYGDNVWSNYPVSDVPRAGLQLGSLTTEQRQKALGLLQVLLSSKGYNKVRAIMGADQVLADAGSNYAAGEDVYTIAIFGTPSLTSPWMIGYGGHHLGLNITISGNEGVMTPTLTGVQPALYNSNGVTVRPLGEENDKAFKLLESLDASQRSKAILNYTINDLVVGPGQAGVNVLPEGLNVSEMTEEQKVLLLDLVSEWAGILNDRYSASRVAEIKEGLDQTYFAWSGSTAHTVGANGTAYYRIQGPKVIIEFSPQAVGGSKTLHVHTMYRDPTNDYGAAFTSR